MCDLLNGQDTLGGYTDLQPFGDRLRGDATSGGECALAAKNFACLLYGIRSSHMTAYVHPQLMNVNCDLIATGNYDNDNQPMIDALAMPQPERFTNFAAWLKAVCALGRGKQRQIAAECGVKPQAVTKWLKGGKIEVDKLKRLATWSGIDYVKLRSLADGEDPREADVAPNRRLMTHTEMGAKVGRKWEELAEPAKTQMLNVIETMLALQKESHRMYARQQIELAKARGKIDA